MNQAANSHSYSAAAIRRFLLGSLQKEERTLVEQRLFEDEEFAARVRIEELALADDYTSGCLSAADRQRFHQRFLVTDDRYRALAVSRLLQTKFSARVAPRATETSKLGSWFDFRQPAWRYAFTVLLLLLVFATVRRVVKEPSLVEQLIPKRILPKSKSISQQPDEAHHPAAIPAPSHVGVEPTPPAHEFTAQTITLAEDSKADHPSIVPAAAVSKPIEIRIVLPKTQTGSLHAELLTIRGESVFATNLLAAGDGAGVTLNIPAGLLKAGDYQIRLTPTGKEANEAVSYYFRVQ